jgi:predicted nucleic acid-binding Zn ribbon protein
MVNDKQVKDRKLCYAAGCHRPLPKGRSKFCSDRCSNRIAQQKKRAKKAGVEWTQEDDVLNIPSQKKNVSARRGQVYDDIRESGLALEIFEKKNTITGVAKILGTTDAAVSMAYQAYMEDLSIEKDKENWKLPQVAEKTLQDFESFRERYFRTEQGIPYETPAFHKKWIEQIMETIESGNQHMILSPPRHGKTDLLIHFVIWLICNNPNIRILWVGGNEDIAKNAIGSVLDQLEFNELLIEEICGPREKFKPKTKSAKSWSQSGFTVGTRTVTGIKSPTMVGIGRGGKILSRDCDIIIADDIEDHSSTMQPASRENTRNWWTTTLSSRKEEHTAMVVIGSRQHYDDIYSHLLENESWTTTVEEAHDSACVKTDWNENDHNKCMLWGSKRTYKWLMDRKRAAETTGGRAIYEMVYLNVAMPEGLALFSRDEIEECRDQKRDIGQIPKGTRLIAGLDPASTGYQAAFLWAYGPGDGIMYMVDMHNNLGGGIPEALNVIKDWWQKYNCSHWVIEENGFQKAIRQDKSIRDFASRHGIFLEGHETYSNKFDPVYGVTALRPAFQEKIINLPYMGFEAQEKVNLYTSQLVYFSSAKNKSKTVGTKTDIVMASWFPMRAIRRMQKERLAELATDYEPSFSSYETSDFDEGIWTKEW